MKSEQKRNDYSDSNTGSVVLDTVVTVNIPIHKSVSSSSLSSLSSLKTMDESVRPQSLSYDREALYLAIRRDLRLSYSLSDDEIETTSPRKSKR